MIPDTCFTASSTRNDGANWPRVTVDVTLPLAVVTTTGTVPVAVSLGACRLICPGADKNHRYAAFPSIVTVVPPSEVGKLPVQTVVPLARLLP